MVQDQQQQQRGMMDFRGAMNAGVIVVRALAVSVEVFLHRGFGARYIGFQAMAALPCIFFFGIFWRGHDLGPLMLFLALYFFACACARVDAWRRRSRGDQVHSKYSGWPWMLSKDCPHQEGAMKQYVEPGLVACGGFMVMQSNQPLGTYLVLAAICLFLSNSMDKAWEAAQAMDLEDAICEQRQKASRFDQLRGR